ncbi:MAG: hypothetical protein ACRCWI_07635 [Brevinema sp.]
MINKIPLLIFLCLSGCQLGLKSDYTGGVTQDILINTIWQQINSDFDGTYLIWEFVDSSTLLNIQRGVSLFYTWEPYTKINGTVSPNPVNQAVFQLTSSIPGATLDQYMLVWIINANGTTAVIEVFSTPEDIIRYLVNQKYVYQANFKKISQ